MISWQAGSCAPGRKAPRPVLEGRSMPDRWNLPYDSALRRLQEAHSGWMIWYVPLAVGGLTWCAKRLCDGMLLHASRPEHLAGYIAAAEAEAAAIAKP